MSRLCTGVCKGQSNQAAKGIDVPDNPDLLPKCSPLNHFEPLTSPSSLFFPSASQLQLFKQQVPRLAHIYSQGTTPLLSGASTAIFNDNASLAQLLLSCIYIRLIAKPNPRSQLLGTLIKTALEIFPFIILLLVQNVKIVTYRQASQRTYVPVKLHGTEQLQRSEDQPPAIADR